MREVWICDSCGAEERTDEGDGPPMTWNINIDNEDFCERCSKLLDPYIPELDETLTDEQIAALNAGAISDA